MKKIYFIILIFFNLNALDAEEKISYLEIESSELIITENPLVSEFIGNVYAKDEENHIWGDKIIISFDDNNEIQLITAIGNIMIKRLKEKITGDKAIYNLKLEKIMISGNVLVFKDNNTLSGDELTMDLITSISIMNGNKKKQVSAKIIE